MAKSKPGNGKHRELKGSVRKRPGGRAGEWRRNGRKAKHVNQGTLCGDERRAEVRASVVARKRRNGRGAKGRREVEGAMNRTPETTPAQVPLSQSWVPRAKQAGEVRARWAWTEQAVWTERMLTALERGVQGGCVAAE